MLNKVSVIVPVYKVEKYLSRCLDSVLGQTFADFEVICVNDGSPDNCGDILDVYAKKDKRIKVINQENQGLSMARNNGLKVASGDYVLFLDSDDCIHPQLLEITYNLGTKYDADMVSFNFEKTDGDDFTYTHSQDFPWYDVVFPKFDKIKHKVTDTPLKFCKKRCRYKISVNSWSKLYKHDFIKDFPFIGGIYFEDYPHTISLMAHHPKTVLLEEKLHYYTYNQTSISNSVLTLKHINDYHIGLDFIYNQYKKAKPSELRFVIKEVFSNILKQQLNKIMSSPLDKQNDLLSAFSAQLQDLDIKGCVCLSGTKLSRYLIYKKLIKKGNQ